MSPFVTYGLALFLGVFIGAFLATALWAWLGDLKRLEP